jgi:hypothetical protein
MSLKWVAHFFSVFNAFGLCAWRMVLLEMILTTFPLELSVYVCVGIIEQSILDIIRESQPHGLVYRIYTTLFKNTNPYILT